MKLKYGAPLSNFAFNSDLRRYTGVAAELELMQQRVVNMDLALAAIDATLPQSQVRCSLSVQISRVPQMAVNALRIGRLE